MLGPTESGASSARRYLDDTLVVETTFRTAGGEAKVLDCFVMREGGKADPHRQLLRIVEGVRGRMELSLQVVARLDYGEVRPWIRHRGKGVWSAMGGAAGRVAIEGRDMRGNKYGGADELRSLSMRRINMAP